MESHFTLLRDFAIIMAVAAVVTVLFKQLKQPVVLGYLIAGCLIGPFALNFVGNMEIVEQLATLGIVLLMFGLGLEFEIDRLKRVGPVVVIATVVEIAAMVVVGYVVGRAFGWSAMESIYLGVAISISSTAIIVKALQEVGRMDDQASTIMIGILVVEDMLAVLMLTGLADISKTGGFQLSEAGKLAWHFAIFFGVMIPGVLLLPKFINRVAHFESEEILLVLVLGAAFLMALLSEQLELSVATGAFVCGVIISKSKHTGKILHLSEPMRNFFGAIFFIATGMLVNLSVMGDFIVPIVVIVLAVTFGKFVACYIGVRICMFSNRTSFKVGAGMSQIGEFSMIITNSGREIGVIGPFLQPAMAVVSSFTAFTTPYLIRKSDYLFDVVAAPLNAAWRQSQRLMPGAKSQKPAGGHTEGSDMKLFNKTQSKDGTGHPFTKQEALAGIAVAAVNSDGNMSEVEVQRIIVNFTPLHAFKHLNRRDISDHVVNALKRIKERGSQTVIEEAANRLGEEGCDTAFYLAADLLLADGIVLGPEQKFLQDLEKTLKIEHGLAERIVQVVAIKNKA